jgi:hypothetical protein
MRSQLRIVADAKQKKENRVRNSIAQYEGILPDAPSNSFKQKKGKMRAPSSEGGAKKKARKA